MSIKRKIYSADFKVKLVLEFKYYFATIMIN